MFLLLVLVVFLKGVAMLFVDGLQLIPYVLFDVAIAVITVSTACLASKAWPLGDRKTDSEDEDT